MSDAKSVTDNEWRDKLTPEQFHILREKGTERAFTGKYDKFYEDGEYYCAGCGHKLFESEDKYNSGCGWPAFTAPAEGDALEEHRDTSFGMIRTEVTCSNCGGHLGHVFPDGPPEAGGLRYCINSAALDFEAEDK
ncbi:peptide-methionine (R)-S-oxide reductase MsrB [Erythrobacter sp. HKB08]|uniref:peptide-methionine (R)-S-oxide reductase MsrB n=1 Tax=Erythrobacter sp. HKB08 TaxID=2502843 RepID=UPI001008DF05|nr:peptide-methionine (R)-S-oxide reductase MsrB [Erythrobacter sp. HKB08]